MDQPKIRHGMPFNLDDLIHRRAIETEGGRSGFPPSRALLLLPFLLLSGCGEAESPRFVPASGGAPASSTPDQPSIDKASREGAIPKNIPMH